MSFFVFSYNQEDFIYDAINGAFAQDYSYPLEIIFSDDCSTDRTFEIIEEETSKYKGPHKVIINKNMKNRGLAESINVAFSLASGQFFIMSAGDDISLPNRTENMVYRWCDKTSPVDLVCSYFEDIDVNGNSTGYIKKDVVFTPDTSLPVQHWGCGATGACAGYDRKLYDKYGPLDSRIVAEDWVFSFRAWAESGIAVIEEPLVQHRTHENSLSVIHRNVNKYETFSERRQLRKNAHGNILARAIDWLNTLEKSGKKIDCGILVDLRQWIELLSLEWSCFDLGRLNALRVILKSYPCYGWLRFSRRVFLRHVIGWH